MRKLKKLLKVGGRRQTSVCVVAYAIGTGDRTTDIPIVAWMQESPTAEMAGVVTINGKKVLVDYVMDDFQYSEEAPTEGGGITRRNVSFSLIPTFLENGNAQPYLPTNEYQEFFRGLYVGGSSTRDIYFEVYTFDRTYQLDDLRTTTCLGIYKMDAGIQWSEGEGSAKVSLYDVLLQEDNYCGSSNATIDDTLFIYNPWFSGNVIPRVYGQVPRVRLLNGTPTFDPMDLSNAITGIVAEDFTDTAGYIVLQRGTNLGSVIRYLSTFNPTLRININDEVIEGDLDYNATLDEVRLINLTRNVPYGSVKAYTHTSTGESPFNWGVPNWPFTYSMRKTVVINARTVIRDTQGWARCSIRFYDNTVTPFPQITINDYAFQFEGFDAEESTIKHDYLAHPTNNIYEPTVISAAWNDTPTFTNPIYSSNSITNNLFFRSKPQDLDLFFRDPTIGPSAGLTGDKWELVSIISQDDEGGFTFEAYIREGECDLDPDHIYAEGDGKLVKVPSGAVTITTNQTAFGESGLIKVQLTDAPVNLEIGASSNVLYADCLWGFNSLPPNITRVILSKEDSLLSRFLGDSFTITGASAWPYYGVIFRGTETISDFLDRAAFQCGMRFYWEDGKLEVATFSPPPKYLKYTSGATQHGLNAHGLTSGDQYDEDSATLSMGRMFTGIFDSYYEFKKMHLSVKYGGWEDPFVGEAKPQIKRAVPKTYIPFDYYYDLINDRTSARYAVLLSLTAGHPSLYSTVDRTLATQCQISALKFSVLDRVKWYDFPFISDRDTAIFSHADFLYTDPTTKRDFLHTGFCVITGLTYSISTDGVSVSIAGKLSQVATPAITELIDDPLADPPTGTPEDPNDGAPEKPGDPPNDPDSPPTGKPPGSTNPPVDLSSLKSMNVSIECDPDCALDSDAGVDVDITATTEDHFQLGFVAAFKYTNPVTEVETALMSHSVANGSNIGSPITSSTTLTVPNSWFEEPHRSITISIKAYISYNDGESTAEETYSKRITLDTPPGIEAS